MLALVTGPTGFLGSHLVERLCLGGHRVRALVFGSANDLVSRPNLELIQGDITRPATLAGALRDVEAVFHTAALVSNWGAWPDFEAVTVRGTENMLEAARHAGVKRFIHISTVRVYDDRYCLQKRTVCEDAPLGIRGFRHFGHYARAKVLAEKCVWRYAPHLPVSVIRPAWIYGPRDVTIIPRIIGYMTSRWACWPSRHDPCADPIYVTDVADCAIAACLSSVAVGQAYHASPAQRISVREFVSALLKALGFESPQQALPYSVSALTARLSEYWARLRNSRHAPAFNRAGLAILTQDVRHTCKKAIDQLMWRQKVSFAEGIRRTAEWIREACPMPIAA